MYREDEETPRETETASLKQLYGELIQELEKTEGISVMTPQKISTAWLIEQMKIENPSGWQSDVSDFIEKIVAARERGGKFEVSHFVDDIIEKKYVSFLETKREEETDEKSRHNLGIMLKMLRSNIEFHHWAKEKGEPVAISGISRDHVPEWYFSTEKEFLKAKMSSPIEGE